jgi:hypothetical protein
LLIPGVSGDLAIGPSEVLYLLDNASGNVNRYDPATGAFLGTFLTPASLGVQKLDSIAFAPGGTLYVESRNTSVQGGVYHTDVFVSKFNSNSGSLISTIQLPADMSYSGPLFVLPVPEPTAWSLMLIGVVIIATRRQLVLARQS